MQNKDNRYLSNTHIRCVSIHYKSRKGGKVYEVIHISDVFQLKPIFDFGNTL